jgi:hypothetical protein
MKEASQGAKRLIFASSAAASPATITTTTAAVSTTPSATASTAAAAITAPSATARTGSTLARFVDGNGSAVDFGSVERLDRLLASVVGLHFHESKSARAPGFAIGDHFS